MAREIQFLRRLDHPNVMKLESIATSRRSIYLVFDYMYDDLARLVFRSGRCLTEPQVSSSSFPFLSFIRRPCTTTTTTCRRSPGHGCRPLQNSLITRLGYAAYNWLLLLTYLWLFAFPLSIHLTGRPTAMLPCWAPCVSEDRTLGYSGLRFAVCFSVGNQAITNLCVTVFCSFSSRLMKYVLRHGREKHTLNIPPSGKRLS